MSVKKHGVEKVLTLEHLLNLCKLAQKYEGKLQEQEERDHNAIMEEVNTMGQD